jgi:hypothetical protein
VGALVLVLIGACADLSGLSGPTGAGPLTEAGTDDASGAIADGATDGTPTADAASADAASTDAAADAAAACTPVQLDELFSSTLRGVKINNAYYAISERRNAVSGVRSIVIGHCPSVTDANFDTCQPYVMSIDVDSATTTSRTIDAHDASGHRFELQMSYDVVNSCWNIVYARVNLSSVGITTQTYAATMNLCIVASEPTLNPLTCPL